MEEKKKIEKVFIGQIISIRKHENADSLSVCNVNVGKEIGELQIVTGAKNISLDDLVPVAIHGSRVINPEDGGIKKIKRGKLRGIESCGMMCSPKELGINEGEDGILILDKSKYMDLVGEVFDLELF